MSLTLAALHRNLLRNNLVLSYNLHVPRRFYSASTKLRSPPSSTQLSRAHAQLATVTEDLPVFTASSLQYLSNDTPLPSMPTVPVTEVSLFKQSKHTRPIMLPNPSLPAYKTASNVLPTMIAEQFAVLHACIKSGNMVRAERIIKELWKQKPEEMHMFADINLYNAFLNGLIFAKPLARIPEMKMWFLTLKEGHGVQPDANTYAVMVKGYLRSVCFLKRRGGDWFRSGGDNRWVEL